MGCSPLRGRDRGSDGCCEKPGPREGGSGLLPGAAQTPPGSHGCACRRDRGSQVSQRHEQVSQCHDQVKVGLQGRSVVHVAAQAGSPTVLRLLLRCKLDPNALDDSKMAPLHYAVFGESGGEVMKLLLEGRGSVHAADNGGATALHYAAQVGQHSLIPLLLCAKADPSVTDRFGNTAMHDAASSGKLGAVEALLDAQVHPDGGLDRDMQYRAATPLHMAQQANHANVVQVLREAGGYNIAQSDCSDPVGLSLIHISEPTRLLSISYAVFCLKKKKKPYTPII
eukprot:TRINITY_DN10732_c0_g1_i1.p1 TRINITY_DN10732_c0_g1~~TRINITY_DN10732_c0_g1_i1.p1  ORF type:complete len:282 (-),score=41.90 TRINITY_DN10732_c0_g1_i1:59-904(-)